ncbi:MAG TPA: terpene utilization protein AtuA, partial [Alphaproteobacteria bacterium]|nr:terpene utilization protein AtuA [Alphaproteobacteria bacterium]
MREIVRIGCGAGFWGDSAEGPKQLVDSGQIDYLVLDYLAEITMSLLARARAKDPAAGYATDFPAVLASLAPKLKAQGIKVVTNAGGVNPSACKAAIDEKLAALGIDLKVSIVTGDDLLPRAAEFADVKEMFSGAAMPPKLWSMNAYLGAFPVAQALAGGADIVLTGRCVDSAVVLGPLIHEFGWQPDDYDKLSAGSLAGHVIECGAQATGGVSTDWEKVAGDWDRMGFPIAECRADGSFVVTKPANTGGRVTPETVAEQIVYEIGDPRAYMLPDVICDFTNVTLEQVGDNRVRVSGAKGLPPSDTYKVSATYPDGNRITASFLMGGIDAPQKGQVVADAILKKVAGLFTQLGMAPMRETSVEILGSETTYGAHARRGDTREVVVKIGALHDDKKALGLFAREIAQAATGMAPGLSGLVGGRPKPFPRIRLFSTLVSKNSIPVTVNLDGDTIPVGIPAGAPFDSASLPADPHGETASGDVAVPLVKLAWARSGDKGNHANIGVIARRPEYLPFMNAALGEEAVADYMQHVLDPDTGSVSRWSLPGMNAFNFLLKNALGGGGIASLRIDPQGKA